MSARPDWLRIGFLLVYIVFVSVMVFLIVRSL